jgi:hypothetical protein
MKSPPVSLACVSVLSALPMSADTLPGLMGFFVVNCTVHYATELLDGDGATGLSLCRGQPRIRKANVNADDKALDRARVGLYV